METSCVTLAIVTCFRHACTAVSSVTMSVDTTLMYLLVNCSVLPTQRRFSLQLSLLLYRFEVLMEVNMSVVVWVATLCSFVGGTSISEQQR